MDTRAELFFRYDVNLVRVLCADRTASRSGSSAVTSWREDIQSKRHQNTRDEDESAIDASIGAITTASTAEGEPSPTMWRAD